MSLIDRVGTFRGGVVDAAVSVTKNGFPQFVIQFRATEYYDEEAGVWIDWSEYDENEITAYQVLFDGKDNKTLNCQQIEKVFGWDGLSFEALNNADYSKVNLQFRIAENTYNDKTSLQVEWLDVYDATPGRRVKKLDASDLKQLQGKYASLLKNTAETPAKAVKAPTKSNAPPKAPKISKAPVSTIPPLPGGKCSKQEAWDACVELKAKEITDEKLATTWVKTIEKIAGAKPDTKVTSEEWFEIKEAVLAKTAIF